MRPVRRHEATAREFLRWAMGTNSYRRPMEQTISTKKESIVNPSVDRARSRRRVQVVAAGALSILLLMVPTAYAAASAGPSVPGVGRAYSNTLSIINNASGDLTTLIAALNKSDVPGMQQAAASYSKTLVTWDAAVAQLRFPAGVHRLVDRLHSINHTEVDDLAAVGRVPATPAAGAAGVAVYRALVDDDAGSAASNALSRTLGLRAHALSSAVVASDRLLLADNTYTYKNLSAQTAFNTADGGKDLGAAKSATAGEKKNLQALLSSMKGLDFPASVHADVVKVGRAAGTLQAFYQRRLLATNYPALHALGPNDTYARTLGSSLQILINDLNHLPS